MSCEGYPENLQLAEGVFDSLEDHRVAMSLAPVSLKFPLTITHPEVVEKSYPEFWAHFAQL